MYSDLTFGRVNANSLKNWKSSSNAASDFEAVLTAILMYVILNVSTGAKEKGVMAGAAIGAVVAFEAMFAGPICGASMNPARSLALTVMSGTFKDQWIYLAAPVLGAGLAVLAYRFSRNEAEPAD